MCRAACGNRDTHRIESDYDDEVLANCEKNGQLNRHLFAHEDVVRVRKLDWLAPPSAWLRASGPAVDHSDPYAWTQADVADYQRVSVLLAADGESARGLDPLPCSTSPFLSLSLRVSCGVCRVDMQ